MKPEKLKAIHDRHQRIVELAADPNRTIEQIAEMTGCHRDTVNIIFRRNNISRKRGRPFKAVSRG